MLRNLQFKPRWKEELVCSTDDGEFSLDFTMGKLKVFLPDEASFNAAAPQWAVGHWNEIHEALKEWCHAASIPLVVEPSGRLYVN